MWFQWEEDSNPQKCDICHSSVAVYYGCLAGNVDECQSSNPGDLYNCITSDCEEHSDTYQNCMAENGT